MLLYPPLHRLPASGSPAAPLSINSETLSDASARMRAAGLTLESGNPAPLALANYLSHRYRIAGGAAESVVAMSFDTGEEMALDPLLILAVIAVESRFNPIAQSGMGAKGLMQIIPKYHADSFGGDVEQSLFPIANIRAGSRILKEYIRTTGSVEAGLQKYNGALWDDESRYAQKILSERARYAQIVQNLVAANTGVTTRTSTLLATR
jgi:soluble lytic murein transglycosylase-like protein